MTLKRWDYALENFVVVATARTRRDGSYAFEGVPQGDYLVVIERPSGWGSCSYGRDAGVFSDYGADNIADFACTQPG